MHVALVIRRAYREAIRQQLIDAGVEPPEAAQMARRMVRDRSLTIGEARG